MASTIESFVVGERVVWKGKKYPDPNLNCNFWPYRATGTVRGIWENMVDVRIDSQFNVQHPFYHSLNVENCVVRKEDLDREDWPRNQTFSDWTNLTWNFKIREEIPQSRWSGIQSGVQKIVVEKGNYKPKQTFMRKLSNMAKKLLDADTQALIKAGFLDENLGITFEGVSALQEVVFDKYKADLVAVATAKVEEETKK